MVRDRVRAPLTAFLIFCGTLFPVLGFHNVYPFRYSYVADHFAYHPDLAAESRVCERRKSVPPHDRAQSRELACASQSWNAEAHRVAGRGERAPACRGAHPSRRCADACHLGYALQLQGRYDEALAEYLEATRADRSSTFVRRSGWMPVRSTCRRSRSCSTTWAFGFSSEAASTRRCVNHGVALERTERVDDAIRQYTLALQIAPGSAEARTNLNRLSKHRPR